MTLSATPNRSVAASVFSEIFAFSDAALPRRRTATIWPMMLKSDFFTSGSA
jgi:hypothetical protein